MQELLSFSICRQRNLTRVELERLCVYCVIPECQLDIDAYFIITTKGKNVIGSI